LDGVPPDDVAGKALLEVVAPPLIMGLNLILGLVVVQSWDHRSTGNLGILVLAMNEHLWYHTRIPRQARGTAHPDPQHYVDEHGCHP